MSEGNPLPSYERPPVNEVVLSVAFDRPVNFGVAQLGDFWHRHLRAELPEIEEQAPYQRPVEVLGAPAPAAINVQLLDRPPSPRLWAKSGDGTKLVQLQADWFAFNWRDAPGATREYPRWPIVERSFLEYFRRFADYLKEEGFGDITARQCEVTYINQIRPGSVWKTHAELDQVLTLVGSATEFLPTPETFSLATAYRISDEVAIERGRLHVTAQPAFQREDNLPIVLLTLVARGEPIGVGEDGIVSFLHLGHEWVVSGFTAITTQAMHDEWGRKT